MFPGRRGQTVDEVVPMVGVQMRKQELARARLRGQLGPLEPGRVAPAPLPVRVFVRSERGVADVKWSTSRVDQVVSISSPRMLGVVAKTMLFPASSNL
jgi:hypothetical protein